MISIDYKGYRRNITKAVSVTNFLLQDESLFETIAAEQAFDMSDVAPYTIASLMRSAKIVMNVDFYYAMSPASKAVGYDDKNNPTTIWLNAWQLSRPIESLCNTMIHACIHALNAAHPEYYFGHGDVLKEGLENTAPYRIGCLAQRLLTDDEFVCEYMIHDDPAHIVATISS